MDFGAGTALLGGLLTFASPCVLPLIPIYLSVLVGGSIDDVNDTSKRFRLLMNGMFFVLGFLAVFVLMGLTASGLGRFLVKYRLLFQQLGGMMVFFFGLKYLGLVKFDVLDREKRFSLGSSRKMTPLGAVVVGFTFAFGWTPCIGPILGSILTFTAVSGASMFDGALYLFLYGLGIGLPLLVVALFAQRGTRLLTRLNRFLPRLEKATGVVLVLVSLAMVTDSVGLLAFDTDVAASAGISKNLVAKVKKPAPADAKTGALCDSESSCELDDSEIEVEMDMAMDQITAGPAMVEFMQPDCPACLKMVPIVQSMNSSCAGEGLRIDVIDISVPENRAIAHQFGVRGTPTFVFFDNGGTEVARLVGAQDFDTVHQAVAVVMGEVCADFSRFDR